MNRDVFKRWLRDPLAWCVLLGAGFVVYRVLGLFHNVWSFTTDDAYITLRYARNWHDGHGITWNAGEKPVEGYSNFLFVVLGYIALTVGASPEMFIKAVSLLALLGSVVLIYRLGRPILGRIGAIAPVLFFVTDKGVLWWTFSGLETIVYAAFALAAFHLYLRATDMAQAIGPKHVRRSLLGAGACIFLASVTRFEGPILGVALAGASLLTFIEQAVRARRTGAPAPTFAEAFKPIVIVGIAAAVPYALYFVWRYAHFGELIPNSYACKLGTEGLAKRRYQDFVTDFMPLLAVAAVTLAFRRSLRHWVLAVPIILYVLLLRDTDTIVAYHNRHFVVVLGGLYILVVGSLEAFTGRVARLTRVQSATAIVVSAYLGFGFANLTADVEDPSGYGAKTECRAELGRWIDRVLKPSEVWVTGDAGIGPYNSDARVIDAYCLNYAGATENGRRLADPALSDRILEARPEAVVMISRSVTAWKPRAPIWRIMRDDARFRSGYTLVHRVECEKNDFCYWVYARNDAAPRFPRD